MHDVPRPRKFPSVAVFLTAGAVLVLASCANSGAKTAYSLYDQLGGESGISIIVNEMLIAVSADERIAGTFARSNLTRLRELLEEQFCEVSDGPCSYSGFSMVESHRGMRVTETEFNAVVESLIAAMEQQGVAIPVQNRFLARLAPLQPEIVYR